MLPSLLPLLKPLEYLFETWMKRPRATVELARVHAQSKHIFRTGFYETTLAELMSLDGTIRKYPGFENYLKRYAEIVVTRTSEAPVVVVRATLRFADGSVVRPQLLEVCDDGDFSPVRAFPTELNYPHALYVSEDGFPTSQIVSVSVTDARGTDYESRHVAPESEIDADNDDVDGFRSSIAEALKAQT